MNLNHLKDAETIEISTEIKRKQNDENVFTGEKTERAQSEVVYDSVKNYINNITNIAISAVYQSDQSEQDDETSIQEIITLQDRPKNGNLNLILAL